MPMPKPARSESIKGSLNYPRHRHLGNVDMRRPSLFTESMQRILAANVVSCGGRGGRIERKLDRTLGTWKACPPCVCESDELVHLSVQTSTCNPPKYICMVFLLWMETERGHIQHMQNYWGNKTSEGTLRKSKNMYINYTDITKHFIVYIVGFLKLTNYDRLSAESTTA